MKHPYPIGTRVVMWPPTLSGVVEESFPGSNLYHIRVDPECEHFSTHVWSSERDIQTEEDYEKQEAKEIKDECYRRWKYAVNAIYVARLRAEELKADLNEARAEYSQVLAKYKK